MLEALTVAGQNAMLLTGDDQMLNLARSQFDHLWKLRQKINDEWQVPYCHNDTGWNDYRPMSPELPVQLWHLSGSSADADRILRTGDPNRLNHTFSARGGVAMQVGFVLSMVIRPAILNTFCRLAIMRWHKRLMRFVETTLTPRRSIFNTGFIRIRLFVMLWSN